MRRMAAPWLVVVLAALAAGCASTGESSKSPGAVGEPPPPPAQVTSSDEVPSPESPAHRKRVESSTPTPTVQCEALAKDRCEAPCSWDKLAEKCTQSLGIVVHE